jgi:hypothetical protein
MEDCVFAHVTSARHIFGARARRWAKPNTRNPSWNRRAAAPAPAGAAAVAAVGMLDDLHASLGPGAYYWGRGALGCGLWRRPPGSRAGGQQAAVAWRMEMTSPPTASCDAASSHPSSPTCGQGTRRHRDMDGAGAGRGRRGGRARPRAQGRAAPRTKVVQGWPKSRGLAQRFDRKSLSEP